MNKFIVLSVLVSVFFTTTACVNKFKIRPTRVFDCEELQAIFKDGKTIAESGEVKSIQNIESKEIIINQQNKTVAVEVKNKLYKIYDQLKTQNHTLRCKFNITGEEQEKEVEFVMPSVAGQLKEIIDSLESAINSAV